MTPLQEKIIKIFFVVIACLGILGLLGIFAYLIYINVRGWNSEKIQALSNSLLLKLNSDPDSTDEFKKFCFTKKTTDCIANVVSKNYPYLSSYATNPNTVLEDEKIRKLYAETCLRDCDGVKGKWTKQFFNAMVVILEKTDIGHNSECCVKYMEKNVDPLDLMDKNILTKVTDDAINSCTDSKHKTKPKTKPKECSSNCYQLQCGDKNDCGEICEDCTICQCPYKKVCNDGKCIDKNVNPDSSCIKNCWHKNCGDSDDCGGICSKCTTDNCFCGPTNVCSYGTCNSCRANSICNSDGKCGANTNGCGGPCDCPDENLCSQGQCVKINTPTNGWDKIKIQELADAMYTFMNLSQLQKPVGSMSYNYLCVTKKTAFCIANSIASNYQYDPKYISDVKTLPSDSQKYINLCLSNCLGVKGNWAKPFFDEILYEMYLNKEDSYNSACFMKKLEENADPVDFFQALVDINQTVDMNKATAASKKLGEIYTIPRTCIPKK
jgi:hypothetical protein